MRKEVGESQNTAVEPLGPHLFHEGGGKGGTKEAAAPTALLPPWVRVGTGPHSPGDLEHLWLL